MISAGNRNPLYEGARYPPARLDPPPRRSVDHHSYPAGTQGSRLTVGVKGDGRRFLSKVIKPREEGAHVRVEEGIAVRAAARTDRRGVRWRRRSGRSPGAGRPAGSPAVAVGLERGRGRGVSGQRTSI